MAITTFRDLLNLLERQGLLRHVARPVDPAIELTTVLRKMQRGPNLALQFDQVRGTDMPVVANVLGRREAIAYSLGVAPEELLPTLVARESATQPLLAVKSAPVQEQVVTRGVEVREALPQIVHSPLDGGPYISAGIFLAKHPETGAYNASWNRTQIVAGTHMRVRMMAPQHLGQYHDVAERHGTGLPAACVIGAPPALMLAASSKVPIEADELLVAGGWQGEPLRVVPALSVPLMVPADAEMVIEGEIVPFVREDEGPFGEFMDAYVGVDKNHVFKVTAITRRKDARYHVILTATPEDLTLLGTMLHVEVFKAVSKYARVRDIGSPGQIMGCVVSIFRGADTDVKAAMQAALDAHRWMKCVVFVNEDVDPHDAEDVIWALHTRFTPDTGILHRPGIQGFSRVKGTHVGKVALDATYPAHLEPEFRRRVFPDLDKIRLEDYVG
jgi:UbiD family decarboxylase